MTSAFVSPVLDANIRASIAAATAKGLRALMGSGWPTSTSGTPLFIKFTSAKYGGVYAAGGPKAGAPKPAGLFVSASPGFTWGMGCYLTPLLYPVSTAIYGRCGIVAEADPSGWQLFDATDRTAQDLYLEWVRYQPFARLLMLSTHSQLANQYLRNAFRTEYRVDCVVFPPDESNQYYTRRRTDRWLAVTEWNGAGELSSGPYCGRFKNPRLSVVLAEEFEISRAGLMRRTLIGPMSPPIDHANLATQIAAAYNGSAIATVSP